MGLAIQQQPGNVIIADGNSIVIKFYVPGQNTDSYHYFRNLHIKDFNMTISSGELPEASLNFNFLHQEVKSFDIPKHIPDEQHIKYIKEQFGLD